MGVEPVDCAWPFRAVLFVWCALEAKTDGCNSATGLGVGDNVGVVSGSGSKLGEAVTLTGMLGAALSALVAVMYDFEGHAIGPVDVSGNHSLPARMPNVLCAADMP